MIGRPNIKLRKFVAKLAVLCVLVQAGIAVWHISAMAAGDAQADSGHAVSCHAPGGGEQRTDTTSGEVDGALITINDCSCCQVILAGAPLPFAADVLPQPELVAVSFVLTDRNIMVGGPTLAADSRGPPLRA